jgi:hypothetical protein
MYIVHWCLLWRKYVRKANKIFLNYNFSTSQAIVENLGIMHVLRRFAHMKCSFFYAILIKFWVTNSHSVLTLRGTDASVVRTSEDAPRWISSLASADLCDHCGLCDLCDLSDLLPITICLYLCLPRLKSEEPPPGRSCNGGYRLSISERISLSIDQSILADWNWSALSLGQTVNWIIGRYHRLV